MKEEITVAPVEMLRAAFFCSTATTITAALSSMLEPAAARRALSLAEMLRYSNARDSAMQCNAMEVRLT